MNLIDTLAHYPVFRGEALSTRMQALVADDFSYLFARHRLLGSANVLRKRAADSLSGGHAALAQWVRAVT